MAYTHGAHNFKFGSQVIRRWATSVQSVSGCANLDIPGPATFIQGQYSSCMRSDNIAPPSYRWWEIGQYAQDDWHVSRSLTLNLGIRWDIYTNKVSPNNRLVKLG